MPTYLITDNQTGRKYKLTGDSPPTESEIMSVFHDMSGDGSYVAPNSLAKDPMNPTREELSATEKARKKFLQTEGTFSTQLSNAPIDTIGSTINRVITEPARIAGEVGAGALNLIPKAYKGYKGLATLATGGSLDDATKTIGDRNIITSPYPSMTGQALSAGINKLGEVTGQPELVGGLAEAAGDIATIGGLKALGGYAVPKVKTTLADIGKAQVDNVIQNGIEKGIRPGIEGNRTFKQQTAYMDKAKSAVKSIVENKDNLRITDEFGEPTQALPKNLKQFSQAIDQTKGEIFNRYNSMAQQAGEAGAEIDLSPIAKELESTANNKALQKVSPGVAEYATNRAKAFNGDTFTASEAQEAISMLNNSLDAFYKNPSYDTASKAYIDSLIANRLRKGLDDVIEQSTGPGYQELKNQYGALKSIEKDVNRRAIVDARRNMKGLIDFSDIFSGAEVVRGIMSMNPSTIAAGATAKLISNLYRMKNNPNRIVQKMFEKVDKNYMP